MNLLEGNFSAGRVRADEYWGTSSHFVLLRNRVVQVDRGADDAQTWTVDIERRNWYWSFIGNVLGGEGGGVYEDNYELVDGEPAPYSDTRSTIWKIATRASATTRELRRLDARDHDPLGNWSYRTNDTQARSGIMYHPQGVVDTSDTAIPASYYLRASQRGSVTVRGRPTIRSAGNRARHEHPGRLPLRLWRQRWDRKCLWWAGQRATRPASPTGLTVR